MLRLNSPTAAIGCALTVLTPAAPGVEAPVPAPLRSAALVRPDVDLYIGVDGAASIRTGEVAGALAAVSDSLAAYTQSLDAWNRLAETLGLTPAAAFDRLLGTNAAFTARFTPPTGTRPASMDDWLLISELDAATGDDLRAKLKLMPRRLVRGLPVLTFEEGRFEVGLAPDPGTGRLTMLLAPTEHAALFDEAVADLDAPAPSRLLDAADFGRLIPVANGQDGAVFVRTAGLAPQNPGTQTWIGAAFRRDGPTLWLSAVSSVPFAPELQQVTARARAGAGPWSTAAFLELSAKALAVSLESNPALGAGKWGEPFTAILKKLDLDPGLPALGSLTGRMAAYIAESPDGLFDAAFALESVDVGTLPPAGDQAAATALARFASEAAPDADAKADDFDFGGVAPGADRAVDVTRFVGPAISGLWKNGLRVAWRYDPASRHERGAVAAAPSHDAPGWWTIGLGPAGVTELSRAMSRPREPEPQLPWVGMLSIRPAESVRVLEAHGVPLPRPAEALRWFKQLTWFTLITPDNLITAGGKLELQHPGPGPATPEAPAANNAVRVADPHTPSR